MDKKVSSESVFKAISLRTRKKHSSEEKVRIVIDGQKFLEQIFGGTQRAGCL